MSKHQEGVPALWRCMVCKIDWPAAMLGKKTTELFKGAVLGCCPKCEGDVITHGKLSDSARDDQGDYDRKFRDPYPVGTPAHLILSRYEQILR